MSVGLQMAQSVEDLKRVVDLNRLVDGILFSLVETINTLCWSEHFFKQCCDDDKSVLLSSFCIILS